jgi:hypothetical protein
MDDKMVFYFVVETNSKCVGGRDMTCTWGAVSGSGISSLVPLLTTYYAPVVSIPIPQYAQRLNLSQSYVFSVSCVNFFGETSSQTNIQVSFGKNTQPVVIVEPGMNLFETLYR